MQRQTVTTKAEQRAPIKDHKGSNLAPLNKVIYIKMDTLTNPIKGSQFKAD